MQTLESRRAYIINELPNCSKFIENQNYAEYEFYLHNPILRREKSASGTIEMFFFNLTSFASLFAPDTIKRVLNFYRDGVAIEIEKNEKGHSLYPLAEGTFNGVTYTVRATSEHKYHQHEYIIEIKKEDSNESKK